MSDIRIKLVGTSPILLHNIQLSDPDHPITREIKAITSKRNKTEDDRHAIEKLEWFGGLYTAPGIQGLVMPTGNIRRCLIGAARINKLGKNVERALGFTSLHVPMDYDGPKDVDALFADPRFHNRSSVRVGSSRVMRVRPQIVSWSLVADAFLLDDVMDFDDFRRVVERAGLAEGLGDNRMNGYGRFVGEVTQI